MIAPILLTLGTLTALYATRGPVSDLTPGKRYLVGLPRASSFPEMGDAQIRSTVESRTTRAARVERITPTEVWLSIEFQGDEPDGFTEAQLLDHWRSIGARGPYLQLFGSF